MWPEAPAELIVTGSSNRGPYHGCSEEERDFEGKTWPESTITADRDMPRFIATSAELSALQNIVKANPNEDGPDPELDLRIAEATRYEQACAETISVSGVQEASALAERSAMALQNLLFRARKHVPETVSAC